MQRAVVVHAGLAELTVAQAYLLGLLQFGLALHEDGGLRRCCRGFLLRKVAGIGGGLFSMHGDGDCLGIHGTEEQTVPAQHFGIAGLHAHVEVPEHGMGLDALAQSIDRLAIPEVVDAVELQAEVVIKRIGDDALSGLHVEIDDVTFPIELSHQISAESLVKIIDSIVLLFHRFFYALLISPV